MGEFFRLVNVDKLETLDGVPFIGKLGELTSASGLHAAMMLLLSPVRGPSGAEGRWRGDHLAFLGGYAGDLYDVPALASVTRARWSNRLHDVSLETTQMLKVNGLDLRECCYREDDEPDVAEAPACETLPGQVQRTLVVNLTRNEVLRPESLDVSGDVPCLRQQVLVGRVPSALMYILAAGPHLEAPCNWWAGDSIALTTDAPDNAVDVTRHVVDVVADVDNLSRAALLLGGGRT